MKKATAWVITAMMLVGLIGSVWAEEPETVQLPAAVETETASEASPAQDKTESDSAEAKAEDETAAPEQTAETVTDEPAEEETSEAPEAPAEDESESEAAEDEAEQSVVSQPEGEKAEDDAFSADVTVYVPARIRMGKVLRVRALVSGANMKYTLHWEKKVVADDGNVVWKTVKKGGNLKLVVDDDVLAATYRLVLTAADGTVKTYAVPELKLSEDTADEAENLEEESFDEDFEEDEYYVEDLEADEEDNAAEAKNADGSEEEPAAGESGETPSEEPEATDEKVPEATDEKEPENLPELPELIVEEPADNEETVTEAVSLETITLAEAAALREQADGMSSVLAELPEGAEVCLIAREGDWLKVSADGTVGYLYQPVAEKAEEAPEAEPVLKVTIFTSRKAVMTEGESIELTSELEGFDNYEIRYQWECNKGEGFEPVEGANDATFVYAASLETLGWDWRLTVYYR